MRKGQKIKAGKYMNIDPKERPIFNTFIVIFYHFKVR
jgi:hypothetical protein